MTDLILMALMALGIGSLYWAGRNSKNVEEKVLSKQQEVKRFTVDDENERWARAHKARLEEIHHAK